MDKRFSECLVLLSLSPEFTEEDLKRAFREKAHQNHPDKKKAHQTHPDKNSNDEFRKLLAARNYLMEYIQELQRPKIQIIPYQGHISDQSKTWIHIPRVYGSRSTCSVGTNDS
jgi:DNA-dependent RNA polymerase auxiliary subunit epsilon